MKKILIITYYWPPSGGAGVQRWVKFVKYLTLMDVKPLVLTVHPDFATYPQTDPTIEKDIPEGVQVFYAKSFELYSLYKKVSSNKEVPYGGFANTKNNNLKEKVIRFIRGNFFIPDPRRGWNRYALAKAKEIIRDHQIDTLITTSPPHSTQLIGLKLKKQLNINWIADLRDPWTDIYYFREMYPTLPVIKIHQKLERDVLSGADTVITVSDDLKRLFSKKIGRTGNNIEVIPNGFDADDFRQVKKLLHPGIFYITYTGTVSTAYNMNGFIQALTLLPGEVRSALRIRFVGSVPSETTENFKKAGLSDLLELTGFVSHEKAVEYMCSSDLLLLVIPEVINNEGILTGKLFEYLATRNPILFIGPEHGDAARIIRKTKSGQVCSYNDHLEIAEWIKQIYAGKSSKDTPQDNHLEYLKYSRENLTRKLLEVLKIN